MGNTSNELNADVILRFQSSLASLLFSDFHFWARDENSDILGEMTKVIAWKYFEKQTLGAIRDQYSLSDLQCDLDMTNLIWLTCQKRDHFISGMNSILQSAKYIFISSMFSLVELELDFMVYYFGAILFKNDLRNLSGDLTFLYLAKYRDKTSIIDS